MPKIRTGLYLRVSHADTIKRGGSSIPAQLARLRDDAERNGETVVETFVEEAKSGTSTRHRTEYQRLLEWVRGRRLDKVRIESVDRGHRNERDRREFEAELQRYGVILQYVGEPEQMPPAMRQFQRSIKGAMAEMESGTTSGRVYKRKKFLVQKRRWQGGRAHYGLRTDGQGWLEADPETFPILLWILEQRAAGIGYNGITNRLNQGISLEGEEPHRPLPPYTRLHHQKPTSSWQDPETGEVFDIEKTPPSGNWVVMTVRNICRNAVDGIYSGVWKWGQTYGKFAEDDEGLPKQAQRVETGETFVPVDLIERVRAVEVDRSKNFRRSSKFNTYLLKPRCGLCGGYMSGCAVHTKVNADGTRTGLRRYRCIGRATYQGTCNMRDIDADYVEAYVVQQIQHFLQVVTPKDLLERLSESENARRVTLERGIANTDSKLDEAQRKKRTAEATLERLGGKISARMEQEYVQKVEDALAEIDQLLETRVEIEAAILRLGDNLANLKRTVFGPLENTELWGDREALRRVLSLLVDAVVVHPAPARSSKPTQVDIELRTVDDLLG